ncbi:MAG: MgtC/SapB family protein [Clostridia bacterium]|nr:MgtC/SapB family protein [Clostridia bacterium]
MTDFLTPILRLLLSVLLGGIIGFERAERGREAGLRTHIMVCLGACLVMLISEYIVVSLGMNTDVTRLGAQVISGIGFLGVGCIITGGDKIKGLTTAAGLWVTACIGLAAGIGYYIIATATTIIMILVMLLITPLSKRILASKSKVTLLITVVSPEVFENMALLLEDKIVKISSVEKSPNGNICFSVTLNSMNQKETTALLCRIGTFDGVIEIMDKNL